MTIPTNTLVADFLLAVASAGLLAIDGGQLMKLIDRHRLTISDNP